MLIKNAVGAVAVLGLAIGLENSDAWSGRETHTVRVNADGSFSPMRISIRDGDTVEWVFNDRTDTIIPASLSGGSLSPKAYDEEDPNEFTGPMPQAPSGIFVLGPVDDRNGTSDWTWESPNVTGVFIRVLWNEVHLGPGTGDASFDFTAMDREIDKAVRNGKLYSLSFKAGKSGTPEWIFDTRPNGFPRSNGGGVKRLTFQDGGTRATGCGVKMDLGSPADPNYQRHYFTLLRKAADHIKRSCNLTDTEAEVLRLIAEGLTPEEISRERGVTLNTTRTHLKHVFSKTGTKRQSELVRMVLSVGVPGGE